MHLRLWHTAAIAGVAVATATAVAMHARRPEAGIVLEFDRPVPADVVARAASLVRERMHWTAEGKVEIDGARIAIETDRTTDAFDLLAALVPDPVKLDIRVLDDGGLHMQDLADHMRKDPRAAELGVTAEIHRTQAAGGEHADIYLSAADRGQYVNTAWAEKHGCDTSQRVEGTGVYCTVTGKQRIEAYIFGDPELFSTPEQDYRPVVDHELLFERDGGRWRTHYARRAPLELGRVELARDWNDSAAKPAMGITLTAAAEDAVQAVTRTGGQLAMSLHGDLFPVQIVPERSGALRLQVMLPADDEARIEYAFALHELPAHLRLAR